MPDEIYKRLTRERTLWRNVLVVSARSSLWLGSDHLLLVENPEQLGFRESYKRFYFRDIQAITARQTSRRAIWNGILAAPSIAALVGIIVCSVPESNWGGVFAWSITAAVFGLPLIINNIRGTACACQIRTAVQTEVLPSISRIRQLHKVLNRIRPLIIAAQGQLTAEEVSARLHEEAARGKTTAPQPSPPSSFAPAPPSTPPPPSAPPVMS